MVNLHQDSITTVVSDHVLDVNSVCFRSYVRFSLFIWMIVEDSCAGSARDLTRKRGSRAEMDKFNLFAFFSTFVTAELLGICRG